MEDLRGKRLLLLGGSYCSDALRKFGDEYGVTLVAAGNDPTAAVCAAADEYYNVNSTDIPAMKKLISQKKIDGVYLGSSEPVIGAALSYVPECGFPCYCNKDQWESIQNKGKLKELFIKFGLPVAKRYTLDESLSGCENQNIRFPVITKPADGCGSSGFTVCRNADELKRGYLKARENSASGEVIVEDFVKNTGVVAFFSFSGGEPVFLGVEDKYPRIFTENGSYVAGLLVFRSRFTDEFKERFWDKLKKMFRSIGLSEGTVWIEVFHDGDDYYFNEAGYRYCGSGTVYPIDYISGVNQVYADMYYALTGKSLLRGFTSLVPAAYSGRKYYCVYPLYVNAGTIGKISGIKELEKTENIVKIIVTKHEGQEIAETGGFSQNFCLVHFVFDTAEELKSTIDTVHRTLSVKDEAGKNLLTEPMNIDDAVVCAG